MSARQEIAAALSATGLVNVTPGWRQSLRPGDGLVRLDHLARGANGLGFVATWQVWLAVPQDLAAAEQWIDANLAALIAAFDTEATVTQVSMASLVLGNNDVNGVILEGSRAAE